MYGYRDELTKNEYLALELTRCWAVGLPNRGCLSMYNVLDAYDEALKHLNKKENNNE